MQVNNNWLEPQPMVKVFAVRRPRPILEVLPTFGVHAPFWRSPVCSYIYLVVCHVPELQQFCKEEAEKMSSRVKTVQVVLTPEYQTREEFLQYFHLLTLDPNSVNNWLRLSEGNTVLAFADKYQPNPDHPDRFDCWTEAMCRESVTGHCYWEVEWSGDGSLGVDVAVTYKGISRKEEGPLSAAGRNDQSWSLFCSPDCCSFWHSSIETKLPLVSSSRIGVYVDHSAGILSFYSISDTMSLIHRVQTTFTQPLYAVFGLENDTTVKICHLTN